MKILKSALLICFSVIIMGNLFAQEYYSKLKIKLPAGIHQRNELLGLLDIDHFDTAPDGDIITELDQAAIQKLKVVGTGYEVLVQNVTQHLDSMNKIYYAQQSEIRSRVAYEKPGGVLNDIVPTPSAFQVQPTFGGYYSFAQMETAMNNLVATYPDIVQKISIGTTYEGRNIWVIKISDNVNTDEFNEPGLLYMGLQHAREAITGSSMIFFMQYLAENYATDTRIKNLIDNREMYIIPCFNPDGWEYNRLNGGAGSGWRKNRSPVDSTRQGQTWNYTAFGVDLNRNWGVDWANCSAPIQGSATSCGSGTETSDTYWGNAPFSEKETSAVRNFVKSKRIVAAFDQHAYGPYYSLPFGRQSLHPNEMPLKGQQFFTAIPAIMGAYNGMRAADSYDALGYEVAGGFKDWMLMGELGSGNKDTIWAMTGEGGAGGGSGGSYGSFWAPASQIVNLCKGMCYQNIQLAYAAGTYVDLQDASDIALNSVSGNLSFRIKRLGIGNKPVTVSLIPLTNAYTAGPPVMINSMNYYQEYTGNIAYTLPSEIGNGQQVKFVWRVEMDGYAYADTVLKIYNPSILFSDNMESGAVASKWNVSGGWDYSSDAAYQGSRSLTESPGGNYTSNSTRVAQLNTPLDLSDNTLAFLSFWTRHRAENFMDKLQVQVSINNGSSWTAVPGITTKQEPGTLDGSTMNGQPALTGVRDYWTQERFDLTDFKNANVLLRFVFTSNGSGGSFKYQVDDGFYIDDIKVVKSTQPLVVLHNGLLTLEAQRDGSGTKLKWTANNDGVVDFYEVQRSSKSNDQFTIIDKKYPLENLSYKDNRPLDGINFYRIRQVYRTGKEVFSNIASLNFEKTNRVVVYPNPVADQLQVFINGQVNGIYLVQIVDHYGRLVYADKHLLNNTQDNISIGVKSLVPQIYQVRIFNTDQELNGICSFLKK